MSIEHLFNPQSLLSNYFHYLRCDLKEKITAVHPDIQMTIYLFHMYMFLFESIAVE